MENKLKTNPCLFLFYLMFLKSSRNVKLMTETFVITIMIKTDTIICIIYFDIFFFFFEGIVTQL